MTRLSWTVCVGLLLSLCSPLVGTRAYAQAPDQQPDVEVPRSVDVKPGRQDAEIELRLERILEATGWFEGPSVSVDEGVVFLRGRADSTKHKEWAKQLAESTEDVVAVVNQLSVTEPPIWDLTETWNDMRQLASVAARSAPLLALGLLLLVATWLLSKWLIRAARALFRRRFRSDLLRDVAARLIAVPLVLLGLYLVLRLLGLSRLAVTLLGGTGLVGLVIGFAVRDIAENFLASLLLSMQRPFAAGDLVEVSGYTGYVQSVNTRATLLMTLEGNHVQIPNATVYKSTITNFTANPNARFDFVVGIGYEDSISHAQVTAHDVLRAHPAVVAEPEPMVLVEHLGPATIHLRVYFWIDIARYSHFKVRSAIIRMTKSAFDRAGISMPDEAREVVFPSGVPVRMLQEQDSGPQQKPAPRAPAPPAEEPTASSAEGDLESEAREIRQQAQRSRSPEPGKNLLDD